MSFQKTKIDPALGRRVNKHLDELGINTPQVHNNLSNNEKIDAISNAFKTIMEVLELDTENNSLKETPVRVGKMFVLEKFWGLKPDNFPKATTVKNGVEGLVYDQMVTE